MRLATALANIVGAASVCLPPGSESAATVVYCLVYAALWLRGGVEAAVYKPLTRVSLPIRSSLARSEDADVNNKCLGALVAARSCLEPGGTRLPQQASPGGTGAPPSAATTEAAAVKFTEDVMANMVAVAPRDDAQRCDWLLHLAGMSAGSSSVCAAARGY